MKCVVYIATSIDGFIATEDGGLEWLKVVERKGEDYGFAKFFASIDALVLGRGTWETVRSFGSWPYGEKPVFVLTHRRALPIASEQFFSGRPSTLVKRLAREGFRRVYVDGGNVISQFMAAGLVDELTISQVPVVLGRGIPLFTKAGAEQRFELVRSRAFDSGLVQTTWQRSAARRKARA